MPTNSKFHFSIGPVQGFVAQARKTRDFWSGSFILSWLSAVAMRAVEIQGGEIEFPIPDLKFIRALCGNLALDEHGPRQGSIPNRFQAAIDEESFCPDNVSKAVTLAWQALAEAVWDQDFQFLEGSVRASTRAIWDRQVNHFWEINWVIGSAPVLLDNLKNWRTHNATVELGSKCSIMEGWQELSGELSPGRGLQTEFWDRLRSSKHGLEADIGRDEVLCAISFIKRRFARYFSKVCAKISEDESIYGWEIPPNVPSLMYLAAVPWLEQVILKCEPAQLENFYNAASEIAEGHGEWHTDIRSIHRAYSKRSDSAKSRQVKRLAKLDGDVFFEHVIANRKRCSEEQARKMLKAHEGLELATKNISAYPDPFYAMLLMDGDSLGEKMSDESKQKGISQALSIFSAEVSKIVEEHDGFLIYAGGDDVLAMLAVPRALSCGVALQASYSKAFAKAFPESPTSTFTISCAVSFVHVHVPLTRILMELHSLLDDVAKDKCGRDSIVVSVRKTGGQALEWVRPWRYALGDAPLNGKNCKRLIIDRLVDEHRSPELRNYSGSFLYKMDKYLTQPSNSGERPKPYFSKEQAMQLLASEYISSGLFKERKDKLNQKEILAMIESLYEQCEAVYRIVGADGVKYEKGGLSSDGARLIHFLAGMGAICDE